MDDLRTILKSDADSEGGPPLPVLYSRCHAIHVHQNFLVASRDTDLIVRAVDLLSRTQSAVECMGVFSSNEDKDDLSTADIKYLLIQFYLASLLSVAPVRTDGDLSASGARLAAVNGASAALGMFLQRCEQYDLLGAVGRMAFEAAAGALVDPAAKRMFKVEKFKREKALNAALGALEARRLAASAQERENEPGGSGVRGSAAPPTGTAEFAPGSANAATAAAIGVGVGGVGSGVKNGSLDEEDERQLWIWRLELAVLQALDLQTSLKQEEELLQYAAAREATAAAAGPGSSSGDSRAGTRRGDGGGRDEGPSEEEKAELMTRLRSICRDLDGNRREQIRQNVFKPGHTLPTLTVEEAGEIERRAAMEREEQQRRQEEKERARRAALDSDEEDAEDKAKQRAWDEWRDTHPKGYGNSKLKPCS